MSGVLQGVRVLELGQVLAGRSPAPSWPTWAPEVVKIERIEGGDDARTWDRRSGMATR